MYNEIKGMYGLFPNIIKTSYVEERAKIHGRFNEKKHLATCAKNRKKRKSKRKNR